MEVRAVPEHDLSLWFFETVVEPATVEKALALITGPGWKVMGRWFLDVSRVEEIRAGYEELSRFSRSNRTVLEGVQGVRAAAWVRTDVAYGMARMYQALMTGTGVEFRLFPARAECAAFLGVEEGLLERDGPGPPPPAGA